MHPPKSNPSRKAPERLPKKHFTYIKDKLWDLWCIASVIGIWPRFIEPNLLITTQLSLPVKNLPKELEGLKIFQFSDLHLHPKVSDSFLAKIQKKVERLAPDLIVFTGDFLCYSQLSCGDRLKKILNSMHAPCGCYAVFGNHDYEETVSLNEAGDYGVIDTDSSLIGKGFRRLFSATPPTGKVDPSAANIKEHPELLKLLAETPFELLNNRSKLLNIKGSHLNICGVGEHMLGKCDPGTAFSDYDQNYPGIILAHNPDCIKALTPCPGNIILCGHTHGAQVNLPWMWRKFIILENRHYKRGLFKEGNKWIYVNRGVGSIMPFRWFSVPEILLITLKNDVYSV